MDGIPPLDEIYNAQAIQEQMRLHPTPAPHPFPGPMPGPTPGPMPGPTPPSPWPDDKNGLFLDFIRNMTPTERADAVPTPMQLENLEMGENYQEDYEAAEKANNVGLDDSTNDDATGGTSSKSFYADMYKDSRELDVNQWIQDNLYNIERFGTMNNQFQFNAQVGSAIGAANGYAIPANYMSNPAYAAAAGGAGQPGGAKGGEAFFQGLGDYLSPRQVAARSVDLAASLYRGANQGGADTVDARRNYASGIGDMVNRSYEQAVSRTDPANADARAALDETNSLIGKGLEDFVQNGLDPVKNAPGGLYDQLRAYAASTRESYAPAVGPSGATPAENIALGGGSSLVNIQA